jgi:hypothetical protein
MYTYNSSDFYFIKCTRASLQDNKAALVKKVATLASDKKLDNQWFFNIRVDYLHTCRLFTRTFTL